MIGVVTVIVREVTKLTTNLLNKWITLSIICIPLSIIRSFPSVFFHLDPKSGGTEKGMTVPLTVYQDDYLISSCELL